MGSIETTSQDPTRSTGASLGSPAANQAPLSASDVVTTIKLAPDAGLVKSLGANHTLESAIADLIDNSIDAGAKNVCVRLLTRADRRA